MPQIDNNGNVRGNFGTSFGDSVRMGEVSDPVITNGIKGLGIECIVPYFITPLAISAGNIFAAAEVANNDYNPLVAGTNTRAVTIYTPEQTVAIELDVARCIRIVGAGPTGTPVNVTIHGMDIGFRKLVNQVTLPTGTETVYTPAAYKYVTAMHTSAASGGTVAVSTSDYFGFPVRADSYNTFGIPRWNNAWDVGADVAAGGGAQVAALIPLGTFTAADNTATAIITTGDRRGTYLPETASDGAKELNLSLHVPIVSGNLNTVFMPPLVSTPATWSLTAWTPTDAAVFGLANYSTGWVGWQT